jgi:hypothetical protein
VQAAGDPQTAAVRSSAFALQAILTKLDYELTADAASAVLLTFACLLGHHPFQKNLKQYSFSVKKMTHIEPQNSTARRGTKILNKITGDI